ncbi:MAG: FHA domain-containing protein [Deltaproteobacteria bacterium]
MTDTATRPPPPVHLMVMLELENQPKKEFTYDFRQNVITMGRDPGNDIQIPLTTVSRNHARIFYEMGDYFLEDLGSTHGSHHNGRKIPNGEKRLLRDGDTIQVMSFRITFKTTAGTALDRRPGEKTEQLARRMVQEVLSSLGGSTTEPPSLRVMNGPDEGNRYELAEDAVEITIGRSPDCDLTLNDQNASRRHCLIKRNFHGFTAQDLGSKNGVLVNGDRIEGAQLIKDGDELQIGGVKLTFIDPPSRLIDQMGGIDNKTMDPEGVGETDGSEHDLDEQGGEEEPFDDPAADLPESDEADDPDPMLEFSGGEPSLDLGESFEADAPLDLGELPDDLKDVGKNSGVWEVLILVAGAMFLLGAIGLILFFVM